MWWKSSATFRIVQYLNCRHLLESQIKLIQLLSIDLPDEFRCSRSQNTSSFCFVHTLRHLSQCNFQLLLLTFHFRIVVSCTHCLIQDRIKFAEHIFMLLCELIQKLEFVSCLLIVNQSHGLPFLFRAACPAIV